MVRKRKNIIPIILIVVIVDFIDGEDQGYSQVNSG